MSISFLMAGILITGAIPTIFQSNEIIKDDSASIQDIKRGLIKLYNATTDVIKEEHNITRELINKTNFSTNEFDY